MTPAPRISLNDTTLRDGEQTPSVAFTLAEKVSIAEALAAAGVPELEAGTPAMGEEEVEALRSIVSLELGARILAWCRMSSRDIGAARRARVDAVNLSIPASDRLLSAKLGIDRTEALERVRRFVPMALDAGFEVAVGAEDASRADPEHLLRLAEAAEVAGASASGSRTRSESSIRFKPTRWSNESSPPPTWRLNFMATTTLASRPPIRLRPYGQARPMCR